MDNEELVELLCKNNANKELKTHNGYTPLMFSCINNNSKIIEILKLSKYNRDAEVNKNVNELDSILNKFVSEYEKLKDYNITYTKDNSYNIFTFSEGIYSLTQQTLEMLT